jgi:type I restriction enzyme S subunit
MSMKWPMVKLGEVLSQYTEYIDAPEPGEYPKLSVKLYGKGVTLDSPANGATLKMMRHQIAKAGQVILSEIWGKKGAIGFVPQEGEGALCTSHFFLFNVATEKLDKRWLEAIFNANYLQEQLDAEAKGTTGYAAVRPKILLACEIPLPPLSEQRRIVARIEELAAKINEARGLRQEAAEEVESLWERAANTVLIAVSERHSKKRLADLVTIRGGGTPSKANPYYWDGQIPWITPKDMKVRAISDSIDHISEHAIRETVAKLIEPGAVLVVVRGMILAHTFPSAVLGVPAAINQDMKALVPNNEILPEFLCAFLWATNAATLDLIEKSTHDTRKLETEKLAAIKVPTPPIFEQRRIVAELDALEAQVDALNKLQAETAAELDALLPSILDKAFTGRL